MLGLDPEYSFFKKGSNSVPKNTFVHACLLLLCVRKCVWFKLACDSTLSCGVGTLPVCHCHSVHVFLSLHDRLLLACLTRYPVITSTLPLYFTLHSYIANTHTSAKVQHSDFSSPQ